MGKRGRAYLASACAYALAVLAGAAVLAWSPVASPWDAALGDVAATVVVFAFSVALANSSMYDPYWSVAPPALFAAWIVTSESISIRAWIVGALTLIWGARLTWNFLRGWSGLDHEDWRYRDLRAKSGRAYWIVSFLGIHFFPTVLTFLGSLSIWVAVTGARPLGILDALAIVVTVIAIVIEALADEQLLRFVRSKPPSEAYLDAGLWRYSRHPNYFGEVTFWWGLFFFALAADPTRWWVVVGPVAITALFVFISIPMIDRRMIARRPAYAAQKKRVSALVPWPRARS